jgi:hypothetical protein
MKSFITCLLLAGIGLMAGGCASPNVNPANAKHGMGYVDFYADDADNLYWDVTDLKTNKKVYYEFDPLQESILRLAFKPGQYELQVTFSNHIIDTPGTAEVDVREGMITPVTVTLLPAGEALFKTKTTAWGSTYFGVYGRRTMINDHPSPSYEVALEPWLPLPYQPKEQMSYFHHPAE